MRPKTVCSKSQLKHAHQLHLVDKIYLSSCCLVLSSFR